MDVTGREKLSKIPPIIRTKYWLLEQLATKYWFVISARLSNEFHHNF